MKKIFLLYSLLAVVVAHAQEPLHDLVVFNNSRMSGDYFFSKTSSTGGSFILNERDRLPVNQTIFFTPGNSLQLQYSNKAKGNWDVIISRPRIRGLDYFKTLEMLSFYIYVTSQNTLNKGFPYIQLRFKDSTLSRKVSFGVKKLNIWEPVRVPINFFGNNSAEALQDIIGVVFSQNGDDGGMHNLYIDDIELVPETSVQPPIQFKPAIRARGFAKHVDIEWPPISPGLIKYVKIYRSEDGRNYHPVGIQIPAISRYTDFTNETGKTWSYKISFVQHSYSESGLSDAVSASTRPMSDNELLDMVQEAGFRYYWEGAESFSGLARENIPGRQNMIASGAAGFGIMALIAGAERKFITRQQAIDRFEKIISFLEQTQTFHGAFSHFIDGPTKRVEPFFGNRDNGGDLVETSFLLQGLLAVREYLNINVEREKNLRDKITGIWERVEWDWYRQYPDSKFLYWHWSPDQEWVINHNLIGWNETMVTYLLAIASPTHAIPASMYYTGWANQDSTGIKYRSGWGDTMDGSMYTNGNTYEGIKLDVGVSNGGPLFFTHYSYMGYDPHGITDKYTNYFKNNQAIAQINYRYCVRNPGKFMGYGDSCWGLTASDGPYRYSADEPVLRQDRGKMAPTGAISSFPYTPVESMKALKNYYYNHGKFLWGEYGFRDAFNPGENWCSEIYMGLNQAPMVVMIENYRSGLIWKLFMNNADVKSGLRKLAAARP